VAPVEKEIIALFNAGDVKAMNLLYDHYADTLYGVVLRMVGDEAVASDILQESLIKIWKNSKSYNPDKGRLFTWLMQIVRSKAIDHIRSSGRRGEIHSELKIVSKGKDMVKEDPSTRHDLEVALSGLEDGQRDLIEHSYIFGYSHPEIAEKFELPIGTVKTRIRNGMKALRGKFGNGH
jgi:RNA polymerase sigma-70 factor (ECF subfamily)